MVFTCSLKDTGVQARVLKDQLQDSPQLRESAGRTRPNSSQSEGRWDHLPAPEESEILRTLKQDLGKYCAG